MIPDLKLKVERQNWQTDLSQAFTQLDDLLNYLELDKNQLDLSLNPQFPLRVPRPFAQKMKKGDINDPLLKQVLPLAVESKLTSGFVHDPLNERAFNPQPGLLHKFKSRVLLITNQSCAVHCRYCFRKHFPYEENRINRKQWQAVFAYIEKDPSIFEVILSGGDPLNLPDKTLQWFIQELSAIKHLRFIRFHTRTPIMIPSRITDALVQLLASSRLKPVIVFHCNHPNELDACLKEKFESLYQHGISLLNQAVLLKEINDDAETMISLCKTLMSYHILPYYLHTLDKVAGSQHLEVSKADTAKLITSLHQNLPGYMIPKVVTEVPHLPFKKPFDLSFL